MSKKKLTTKTKPAAAVSTLPVKKESLDLTLSYGEGEEVWGAGEKVEADEVMVPKAMLMQSNSTLVTEREDLNLKAGDYVHSITEEVIASRANGFEVIIFDRFSTRQVFEGDQYIKSEPWEPGFSDKGKYPYDGKMINGVLTKWKKVIHYLCLRPEEVENGESFPLVLSFKGLGMRTAGTLATELNQLKRFRQPSAARVFKVYAAQEKTDNGTFWVMKVDKARKSTVEEIAVAKDWYHAMQFKNSVIHETDDTTVEDAEQDIDI